MIMIKNIHTPFLLSLFVAVLFLLCLAAATNHPYSYAQPQHYSFVTKWGSSGSGDGQFRGPNGIAVDIYDNIYTVDSGNHRIQKFNDRHSFVAKWGSQGTADGEFVRPFDIALDSSGIVYVTDRRTFSNHTIQGFYNGKPVISWGSTGSGDGQFRFPTGIAVNSSGYVHIANTASPHRIQKFTYDGNFIGWIGKCTGGSNCDLTNQRAKGFSCNANTCTVDNFGSGDGQFQIPTHIAIDPKMGYLYIADMLNHRIQKFTYDGNFIGWIGKCTGGSNCDLTYQTAKDFGCNASTCTGLDAGRGPAQFLYPGGIAIDSSGNLFVADNGNYRIQKFSSDGEFISAWGSHCNLRTGSGCYDPDGQTGPLSLGDGQFSDNIGDVAVDSLGKVYVSDNGNDRIQVFQLRP
jgi:tripartite motif-containing protein 71